MIRMLSLAAVPALSLGMAWGASGLPANGEAPQSAKLQRAQNAGALSQCDIRVGSSGGMLTLEGVASADVPLSGSYELKVTQTGGGSSANIVQSGAFDVAPGMPGSLGTITLSNTGGYAASLRVRGLNGAVLCTRQVGTTRI
ncbi:curli-like amyloid fiber formation chaperone CsgH [Methyloligella sp. 2.7D]|uniref:curli-like amyloid fiber formation chaperone CsgH n=1 Tax=unclassified Methyloligella TaxID=2625955 RepID=UPI00157D2E78|nr:curli-like amyloid fiber formation chaperone CsgH [Methyloligella sp. GL2]QKP78407.1 hypothetical protein HT051_13720 [Methyloligella sp. GL2]